jgi:UDP-N-acetylmuramate dehydrogenase
LIEFQDLKITENFPLAPLTTLEVGGPARFFVEARKESHICSAVAFCREKNCELFVLGGGSNIIVSDSGFDGLVLKIGSRGVSEIETVIKRLEFTGSGQAPDVVNTPPNVVDVDVAAGEDWDQFVGYCIDLNLAGLECLSGIPGSVGGTPVQNVGAYGQEVSETIVSVRCFDTQTDRFVELLNEECGFSYRTSIFNSAHSGRYMVLSVRFRLVLNGRPKIVYKDLVDHFGRKDPSLKDTRNAVLAIRAAKSMVIDPRDPNSRSVGSFFKNPIIEPDHFDQFRNRSIPHFTLEDGRIKVPAAWLIEHSGFHKGFRLGNVGISANHSLAIVNLGGATAKEVVTLKDLITERVNTSFGIELKPEPVFVGF